jgi:hypothetical protein
MFRVFANTKGYRPELWAVKDGETVLVLLVPVAVKLGEGLMAFLPWRSVAYGSVLVTPTAQGRTALELLLQTYRAQVDRRILFTELRNLVSPEEWKPTLVRCGFEYEPHLNYLIHLGRPPQEIFNSMTPNARTQIRRAERGKRVRVIELQEQSQLADWYTLVSQTYARAGVPVPDISLFEASMEYLQPRGMCIFWMAEVAGAPASCLVELLYRKQVYGWYGGTDRTWSADYPTAALRWHVLQWGSRNGYELFDFGGAGKPDQPYGVRDFKAKFGGQLVDYGRFVCAHSPRALKVSKAGYRWASRFLFGRVSEQRQT